MSKDDKMLDVNNIRQSDNGYEVSVSATFQRKLYPNDGVGKSQEDFEKFNEGLYDLMEADYGKPVTPYPNNKARSVK